MKVSNLNAFSGSPNSYGLKLIVTFNSMRTQAIYTTRRINSDILVLTICKLSFSVICYVAAVTENMLCKKFSPLVLNANTITITLCRDIKT